MFINRNPNKATNRNEHFYNAPGANLTPLVSRCPIHKRQGK